MYDLAKNLTITSLILIIAFSVIKALSVCKHLALAHNLFPFLKDERLSRLTKVIWLAIAGLVSIYFVTKGLPELFVGLLYCLLMYQVAVLEAPPEEKDDRDDDFY